MIDELIRHCRHLSFVFSTVKTKLKDCWPNIIGRGHFSNAEFLGFIKKIISEREKERGTETSI